MAKILLVEDEEALLEMYKLKFQNENFEVRGAKNGEEGLKEMRAFLPDLVLLDFSMPKVGGLTVLEEAKQDDKIKHIPIVFLTNIFVNKEELVKKGADRCLNKADYTPSQIVAVVNQILSNKKQPA